MSNSKIISESDNFKHNIVPGVAILFADFVKYYDKYMSLIEKGIEPDDALKIVLKDDERWRDE